MGNRKTRTWPLIPYIYIYIYSQENPFTPTGSWLRSFPTRRNSYRVVLRWMTWRLHCWYTNGCRGPRRVKEPLQFKQISPARSERNMELNVPLTKPLPLLNAEYPVTSTSIMLTIWQESGPHGPSHESLSLLIVDSYGPQHCLYGRPNSSADNQYQKSSDPNNIPQSASPVGQNTYHFTSKSKLKHHQTHIAHAVHLSLNRVDRASAETASTRMRWLAGQVIHTA